jgi:hydroxyacylglutathione hydrolase
MYYLVAKIPFMPWYNNSRFVLACWHFPLEGFGEKLSTLPPGANETLQRCKYMTDKYEDDTIRIEKLQLGPWGTNAYIVVCRKTSDSLVVDAPAEAGTIVKKLRGTSPRYVLLTHDHMDHVGALAGLRKELKVPLAAHAADGARLSPTPEIYVNDGDILKLGNLEVSVLHTPGHTAGSVCFKVDKHLFSGDTIFPGGPGKTWSPGAFGDIMLSIRNKILVLPDDTLIYPGHGETTVLKKEKEEIGIFSSRSHDPGLCGDVLWLSS